MLQTLDQMTLSKAKPVPHQTWAAIPEFLDGKVAAKEFELLKAIAGPHRDKKMIPFRNTLTMAARRAGLGSGDINQPTTATRNVSGGSRCA